MLIGWMMLLTGVAIAWIAGYLRPYPGLTFIEHPWRAGAIAMLLAGMIVAYDRWLKRTPLGPVAMGSCRALNLLLGMSTASRVWCNGPPWSLHYEPAQLLIAGGMGVYVAGITWFARTEARDSNRVQLSAALAVMVAGLALVASYAWIGNAAHFPRGASQAIAQMRIMWPLLIMLIGVTIVRRAAMAVQRPIPSRVQQAVKTAILSIILLDAAIAMLVGPVYAVGVLLLLAPTLLLARWVYST
jgi:4-hydroxybenzoate polyprenyltransferase